MVDRYNKGCICQLYVISRSVELADDLYLPYIIMLVANVYVCASASTRSLKVSGTVTKTK